MDKTLLLLTIFVLLLNSSHEARKYPDNAMKTNTGSILDEKMKQDMLDMFKTVYNIYSNDTFLSNIRTYNLLLSEGIIHGEVEMDQTTCTRFESFLNKCPFKTELQQREDNQGTVSYVKFNTGRNKCNKFLSELENCPFNEQEDEQKRALCSFKISNYSIRRFETPLQFRCLNF